MASHPEGSQARHNEAKIQLDHARVHVMSLCAGGHLLGKRDASSMTLKAIHDLAERKADIHRGIEERRGDGERMIQLADLMEKKMDLEAIVEANARRDFELAATEEHHKTIRTTREQTHGAAPTDVSLNGDLGTAVNLTAALTVNSNEKDAQAMTSENRTAKIYTNFVAVANATIEFLEIDTTPTLSTEIGADLDQLNIVLQRIQEGLKAQDDIEQQLVTGIKQLSETKKTMLEKWAMDCKTIEDLRDNEEKMQDSEYNMRVELNERAKKILEIQEHCEGVGPRADGISYGQAQLHRSLVTRR